jgi:hypothetical protein
LGEKSPDKSVGRFFAVERLRQAWLASSFDLKAWTALVADVVVGGFCVLLHRIGLMISDET